MPMQVRAAAGLQRALRVFGKRPQHADNGVIHVFAPYDGAHLTEPSTIRMTRRVKHFTWSYQ